MSRFFYTFLILCTLTFISFCQAAKAPVHLRMTCGTDGKEYQFCKAGAERWAQKTGNTVEVVSIPHHLSEFATLTQMLASEAHDVDIYLVDTVWIGTFAEHFVDLSGSLSDQEKEAFFPSMLNNNYRHNQLVALPWYTDAGLLYYRQDLLDKYNCKVPETWEELYVTAKFIQDREHKAGKPKLWGFVFQGRAEECLTCVAYEWLTSSQAGTLIDATGNVSLDKPQAINILTLVSSWIGTIVPPGVLNYTEEDARGVFQTGLAVFMRNWPYVWSLANGPDSPIAGKIGIAPLPRGSVDGKHTATLGGWQLAVSKYSHNIDAATDLIRYLTGFDEQKIRAIEGGFNPTRLDVYENAEVIQSHPFFQKLLPTIRNAIARPSTTAGSHYEALSNGFAQTIHGILSKRLSPHDGINELNDKLQKLSLQIRT